MRSQFGPVMVSGDMSEVSLYLPALRLLSYGMEQLVWAALQLHIFINYGQVLIEVELHLLLFF